ncbi:PrsW family intramembrane metalloprotease [Candidatus Peregrinibacteria bacterium]|nr:PrsW family intramembrane metalloprotease [Candidatus Peregrinibacteria bacterium]
MSSWFPAIASTILAAFPVIIWIEIIHREGEEKSLYIKTFLLGTLAVIPPFILIWLFDRYPQLDIYSEINSTVEQIALAALLTNIVVGIIEELAKNVIVRVVDKRHPEYFQTITSALKLSLCAGLGFAFAENIFYFYNVWTNPSFGYGDLFSTFIFRSLFTMAGHMLFSGIFGYYFGVGKFASDITEFARWEGREFSFARWIAKITGKMTYQVVREFKNLTGLLLAMGLHAAFNVSLDLEHKLPSILIVVFGAAYIAYLLQTKSGHLLFSIGKRRSSTMASRDQDVVMELLGMWTREGKYMEVIQICDRLLARDPDNNVVKLFRAKAGDNQELKHFYTTLKDVFRDEEKGLKAAGGGAAAQTVLLPMQDEKVVLELMDQWYREGKYKQALDVANRLLERNPNSQGAKVLLDKAMDREKLRRMFDALSKLFTD